MNMYAAHKTTYTHLECKSIPIDDILQRLWIKTTAEECLSVYQQCDRDMRCKEQKEGDPGVSLKRQHDYLLLLLWNDHRPHSFRSLGKSSGILDLGSVAKSRWKREMGNVDADRDGRGRDTFRGHFV